MQMEGTHACKKVKQAKGGHEGQEAGICKGPREQEYPNTDTGVDASHTPCHC